MINDYYMTGDAQTAGLSPWVLRIELDKDRMADKKFSMTYIADKVGCACVCVCLCARYMTRSMAYIADRLCMGCVLAMLQVVQQRFNRVCSSAPVTPPRFRNIYPSAFMCV